MLVAGIVCGVVLVWLVVLLVVRERRVFRAAAPEQPATLEGGGSHLSARKGAG